MSDPTVDRLEQLQAELQQILEDRLSQLARSVRSSEAVARRIVAAELEIERHSQTAAQLEADSQQLELQLMGARSRAEEARERHGSLAAERDRFRTEVDRIDGEVRGIDQEVGATRQRVTDLEAEANSLRTENASLKTKLKTLEENVTRMRRLKEELMSSISGLTQEMSGLAGGGQE